VTETEIDDAIARREFVFAADLAATLQSPRAHRDAMIRIFNAHKQTERTATHETDV
jgi:hypothetical protein